MRASTLRSVPGLFAALTMMPLMVIGWALLLPVVPLAMTRVGASTAAASANTAVFMTSAVAAQVISPWLLRNYGYRRVIVVAALTLGVPCLGMLVSAAPWWWYLIAAVRGIGFGALSVACTALPSVIASNDLLGRVAGVQGVTISLSQAIGLGSGLVVADVAGLHTVLILGVLFPMLICVLVRYVPAVSESGVSVADPSATPKVLHAALKPVKVILSIGVVAAAFGGLSVLLPIGESNESAAVAALTVLSLALMVGRYLAGLLTDRGQHGRLAVPSMVLAALSVAMFSWPAAESYRTVVVVLASIAFGFAFGVLQNDTLISLYHLFAKQGKATASKWWNIGIDCGMGLGSVTLGALASSHDVSAAYIVAAVVLALAAPLCFAISRLPALVADG